MNIFTRPRHAPNETDSARLDSSFRNKAPLLEKLRSAKATLAVARTLLAFSVAGTAATASLVSYGCRQMTKEEYEKEMLTDAAKEIAESRGFGINGVSKTSLKRMGEGLWEVRFALKSGETVVLEAKILEKTIQWSRVADGTRDYQKEQLKTWLPTVLATMSVPDSEIAKQDIIYQSSDRWIAKVELKNGFLLTFKVEFNGTGMRWHMDRRPEKIVKPSGGSS